MATTFVSTELAARIDHAEARLSASLGHAARARAANEDVFVDEIGGGVAVYTGPSSPMNKMIGIGFDGKVPIDALRAVEEKFKRRGAPLQAEVSTLADPDVASNLTRRGYVLQGFENVLGRVVDRRDADGEPEGVIEIAPMDERDAAKWLDVAITGFMSPDQQGVGAEPLPPREILEAALRGFGETVGFRRYFARIGEQVAGVATVRFDGRLAQLCGAATLPGFRRRGVQTALLRRRLADAYEAGCELALLTTSPGSTSQENGHRQGFELLYSRALLVKPVA
ncbi:MAG TPA: GNAT family N-acetyltransferase [Vicinamibacterales bacterium]|jgi:ribosomal protein S18 acetylase RimI-like enzyme